MSRYLLDSYAWLEYFDGSASGTKVGHLLEQSDCFTSSLSMAEVTIKLVKNGKDPTEGRSIMAAASKELPITHDVAYEAGLLYVEKRQKIKDIGIVDVTIMVQARKNGLTIVTGDVDHFKNEKNVLLL